jgi:hypothetical protein
MVYLDDEDDDDDEDDNDMLFTFLQSVITWRTPEFLGSTGNRDS